MPKLDFEVITLGHGSGGLLTNQLLESGVFNILNNEILAQKHDGAILPITGQIAFTTDSFVISPLFFPNSNIGELAIHGTLNDLAMCGAIPQYLSLSFILEEGLTMEELWEILLAIKVATEKAGIQIVTGDTKVVEKGKGDKIFINTAGIGTLHPKAQISLQRIKPNDAIIISGSIANHGIAIMSVREGLTFETTLQSDTKALHHATKILLDHFGEQIHLLKDPTRGGVAAVLNEVARDAKIGIELHQKYIPIAEQVEGACEILGLDPLYVANEGIFISIVDEKIANDYLELLKSLPEGKEAAIIGKVVEQHPKQVVLNSQIGGKRVVNMPIGEQLPRIC
ncbi:MAG: hydrogenase expression/formation protein HypE [Cytophagales bacterium]|nr:MAG: hydrogenase expression/formation protein HypE [Cytophagales bacterium]